jgi:pyruvate/2-oxoglutarate dehydrogenase complex dihydrolipoamide dehydrogenase (E3) component
VTRCRSAFVGRELLGGTCLTRGCIPTRTMLASAEVAQQGRRAGELGVPIDGGPRVALPGVVDRRHDVVESLRKGSCPGAAGGVHRPSTD